MMSESRTEFIDKMFHGITLCGKSCLDIGYGLGGAAFYLANARSYYGLGLIPKPSSILILTD